MHLKPAFTFANAVCYAHVQALFFIQASTRMPAENETREHVGPCSSNARVQLKNPQYPLHAACDWGACVRAVTLSKSNGHPNARLPLERSASRGAVTASLRSMQTVSVCCGFARKLNKKRLHQARAQHSHHPRSVLLRSLLPVQVRNAYLRWIVADIPCMPARLRALKQRAYSALG